MKVLFYRRANHQEVKGGDLIQMYSTTDALKAKGVDISYSSDPELDLAAFDVVHLFNSPRFDETLTFMANAQRQSKPVAFSTIFWSKEELAIGIASSPKVRLARRVLGIRSSLWLWRLIKHRQGRRDAHSNYAREQKLFAGASLLLPNSEGEMREIIATYGPKQPPHHVVRNAIDGKTYRRKPNGPRQPYVLSVGRIENRKNTLKLIQACHRLQLPLTLIGGHDPNDSYAQACLELVKRFGFRHLPNLQPKELLQYYYEASVHAMVSWYETPGLSSMEAACGGCTIVSTDRGSTTEYFGTMAQYCDPFSQKSIETALSAAMKTPPSTQLRDHILHHYTWDGAAEDTLAAYQELEV